MRIVIADDHALFRDSLEALLAKHEGIEVVGHAANGREAIEMAWRHKPDVVLMDLAMPELSGLEATRRLAAELPEVKVVILTANDEDAALFEAMKSGAKGYLPKDVDSNQFVSLLQAASLGAPALTPPMARKLLEEFARPRRDKDPDALTTREVEVLQSMVDGTTTNRKLAEALGISENTVKFHVRNILDKLHLNNRAEVVAHALRNRLVDPSPDES